MVNLYLPVKKLLGDNLILEINPQKIDQLTGAPLRPVDKVVTRMFDKLSVSKKHTRAIFRGFVVSGNWDKEAAPICESEKYLKILDLIQNKHEYRKSIFYHEIKNKIDNGKIYRHKNILIKNDEDINGFFKKYMLEMIDSLQNEGYLDSKAGKHGTALIGRNGELIKAFNGQHRFFAAKILGLNNIKLLITTIHRDWFRYTESGFYGKRKKNLIRSLRNVEIYHT